MENKSYVNHGGICDFLTLIFITLRACGITNWKWWQILMPEFIGIAFGIVLVIVILKFRVNKHIDTEPEFYTNKKEDYDKEV